MNKGNARRELFEMHIDWMQPGGVRMAKPGSAEG